MRSIPVDLSKFTFVCVAASRPRLLSKDTGEVKTDRDGNIVYQVGLSAADESGRVELVNVSVSGDPEVSIGQIVVPVGLVAFPWEIRDGGTPRSGIAFRADQIIPAVLADRPASGGPERAAGLRDVSGGTAA